MIQSLQCCSNQLWAMLEGDLFWHDQALVFNKPKRRLADVFRNTDTQLCFFECYFLDKFRPMLPFTFYVDHDDYLLCVGPSPRSYFYLQAILHHYTHILSERRYFTPFPPPCLITTNVSSTAHWPPILTRCRRHLRSLCAHLWTQSCGGLFDRDRWTWFKDPEGCQGPRNRAFATMWRSKRAFLLITYLTQCHRDLAAVPISAIQYFCAQLKHGIERLLNMPGCVHPCVVQCSGLMMC